MNTLNTITPQKAAAHHAAFIPTPPSDQFKRAVKLHQQGDLAMAEFMYRQILREEPDYIEVNYLLGLLANQTGRPAEAVERINRYLEVRPDDAQAMSILSLSYYDLKDFEQARSFLEKSIRQRGGDAHLYYNLGKCYFELKLFSEAINSHEAAIRLQPTYTEAYIGKAIGHMELREFEAAACVLEHAILLDPLKAETHFFYGNAMRSSGETHLAIEAYETALALKPDHIDALINLATSLKDIDRLDEAFVCYDKALALQPDHPEGNYNKALTLLWDREFSSGWKLHEWRMFPSELLIKHVRPQIIQKAPAWNGAPLDGHLLVLAEQGLGDQVFFSGMLQELSSDVKAITVCTDPRLIPVFKRSFPSITFATHEQIMQGQFDAQIYIGSLGRFYRSSEESFNKIQSPYLMSDKDLTKQLSNPVKKSGRLLCGLSWRSRNLDHGEQKTLPLEALSQVLCLKNIDFVDLQYGDTTDERHSMEKSTGVRINKLDDIDNFNDIDSLSALISACDVVVTVSNSTAHLAAALGKPTLVLLPKASSVFWYWHRQTEHSPWYPTVRLLRKDELGDWPSVMDAVTLTLAGIQE